MPIRMLVAVTSVLALLTACGSSTPAAVTPQAGTPGPGATGTVTPVATGPAISQPPVPTPGGAGDPELAARFPTQVDGQPVTNVTTARFIDVMRSLGNDEAEIEARRQTFGTVSIDLETISYGNASATVGGDYVGINALRFPGRDAASYFQIYQLFSPPDEGDSLAQETIGGKSVMVVRSQGGFASDWLYASGDTVWQLNTSSEPEAAAVFAALP